MKRITLTDGSGRWFDQEKAIRFDEDSWWDGNNHISSATGSQFDHEILYHTSSGRWILHKYSQWQGRPDTYVEIGDDAVSKWLANNNCYEKVEQLPRDVQERICKVIAETEV